MRASGASNVVALLSRSPKLGAAFFQAAASGSTAML
jgi:hypothetical protein